MPSWSRHKYLPIGLDIAQTAVRGIQLVRQKNILSVHSALEKRFDGAVNQSYEYDNETEPDLSRIVEHLKILFDHGDFVGRDVVLHCPADKLDIRPVELPAAGSSLPRSAILGALRLQMGGHLPFDVDHAVFDYYLMDSNPWNDTIRVMAVTASGAWIKQQIQCVESLGLHCLAVEALPCVLARISAHSDACPASTGTAPKQIIDDETLQENTPESLVVILDTGYSGSTLIIRHQHRPIFCRRFSFSGPQMTEIISQRLGVDFSLAEILKQNYGLDCQARRLRHNPNSRQNAMTATMDHLPDQDQKTLTESVLSTNEPDNEIAKTIYAALQSDLGQFVKGLTRSLNYVITNQGGARLEKIHLCGSAVHTRNLDRYLGQQFDLPVEIIQHPLLSEITANLPASRSQTGAWTTALGLALLKETD